jgi:hypothetical protein
VGVYDRVRNFVARRTSEDQKLVEEYIRESNLNRSATNYGDVFSRRNRVYTEIPLMLQDPIISSAVAIVMESAFQPSEDNTVFKVRSPYQVIVEELNEFHSKYNHDETLLTTAFNVLVYGNVPIKMEYSPSMQFERVRFIPDFTRVTPIVVSNRTLGYLFDGKFYDAYEFVYAQHLYYKDLGGPNSKQSLGFYRSEDQGESERKLENEFVLAPSYLSPAVKPWRNIKIIEDALILQRLDVSNFMRIIGVNVGDAVYSKNAIKLLNFYRQIFKKVRRVSFDGEGMSSSSLGNDFEVIVPTTSSQSIDIKEIGGQCLRGSTKVRLLDGRNVPIKEMYDHKDEYLGKGVYTCAKDGTVGVSPIVDLTSLRKNTNFVRVHLDNGEFFDVTPDHPCQLRGGDFMEAQHLRSGDSLMPLYVDEDATNRKGYLTYLDNRTETRNHVHMLVGDYLYQKEHGCLPPRDKSIHRHHKNRDKKNNDFSNIELLPAKEHAHRHRYQIKRAAEAALTRLKTEGSTEAQKAAWRKNIVIATQVRDRKWAEEGRPVYHLTPERIEDLKSKRIAKWKAEGISDRQRAALQVNAARGRELARQKMLTEGPSSAQLESARKNILKAVQASIAKKVARNIKFDLVCAACGRPFQRMEKPSRLRGLTPDQYASKPRFCSIPCRAVYNSPHADKSVMAFPVNHKVVSVEFLDVVEDSYDLTVESKDHCFALSAGVFVHNTDVRALRDLDIMYKKLFSALKIQASMIGFSEDAPSSLGESGATQRWDERFGRLVKALRMSVTNSMKQIDVNYLRSKGYDVSESDFTYTYIAASTVEDAERRETMKTYISAIGEIVSALDGLNQAYNKDYVVKELFASALSSTSVDIDKLFTVEQKPRKVEAGDTSRLIADRIPIYSEFKRLGVITDSEFAEVASSGSKLITSASSDTPILSYRQYLALGDLLAAGRNVNLAGEVQHATIQEANMRCVDRDTVIPVSEAVFASELLHPVDNLASGASVIIDNLYLVNGGHYLHSADLYNYLYMKDQGARSVRVRKVWKE